MKNLQILHITPWYPTPQKIYAGIFVQRHIQSLSGQLTSKVFHINFDDHVKSWFPKFKFSSKNSSDPLMPSKDVLHIQSFPTSWWLREFFCFLVNWWYLTFKATEIEVVNFYIAYPTAVYIRQLKKLFPKFKWIITEQWSAYHMGFKLPKGNRGRNRIEQIFLNDTPLFVVSNALGNDIQQFCGKPIPFQVIPNIVDNQLFSFSEANSNPKDSTRIVSVNSWSAMKNPVVLLEAFALLLNQRSALPHNGPSNANSKEPNQLQLVLAGGGDILIAMRQKSKDLRIEQYVQFPGPLTPFQVAELLRTASIYCQSSNYETFSVICVEALSSGVPVVATNIGGMKDFVNDSNGLLVNEMTPIAWAKAINDVLRKLNSYDRNTISQKARIAFNSESIGKLFAQKISEIL